MSLGSYSFLSFRFDPRSGILTRNGKPVRVARQEALLLTILLDRAGTVVTRDEIQRLLWPDGSSVEYDQAINRAVNQLRALLRDSSQKSRFIETFPKRGYRFMETVTRVSEEDLPAPVTELVSVAMEAQGFEPPIMAMEPAVSGAPASVAAAGILPTSARAETAPRAASSRPALLGLLANRWVLLPAAGLVTAIVAVILFAGRGEAHSNIVSVGIAPLDTLGDGADRLGENFRMDLLDALSELPTVQLRASHSLDKFPHDDAMVREVAREMHLDVLLLGKLVVQNNVCTLNFELVRGDDAVHLASLRYSGSTSELTMIRERVQRDVYAKLQGTGRSVQTARGSTQNQRAYEFYLRGRELTYQRTPSSLEDALRQYDEALKLDPNFARAYAGVATTHLALYNNPDTPEDLRLAKVAAEKALQFDPDLAEAHAVLGNVYSSLDWNFAKGESELRHALDLDPHQATYHAWLAEMLAIEGQFQASLHEIDLAHADDPLWPQVFNIEINVAAAAKDYERSMNAARRYAQMTADSPQIHEQMAWTLFMEGRHEDAIAEWRNMAEMENDPARVALEERGLRALHRGGPAAYAALRLQASLVPNASTERHPNDFYPAEWHAYLHNNDQAIDTLQKMVARHDPDAVMLAINPMFDNLHSDPRYLALLSRVGLKLPVPYPQNL